MKLFKYNQFIGEMPLNEDLDKAKKLLKDRYLTLNVANELGFIKGELKAQLDNHEIRSVTLKDFTQEEQNEIREKLKTLKISPDKIKQIEQDPDFKKIRELTIDAPDNTTDKEGNIKKYNLDKDNKGWIYMFTYFYFIEMVSIDELKGLYSKLIEFKGLLDKLPKKFDINFIDPSIPNATNRHTNFEVLIDNIAILDDSRKIKKVYDQLTPILKKDYNDSPKVIKAQFDEVATSFSLLGDGDPIRYKELWNAFFGEEKTIPFDQEIYGVMYKKGQKRYFGTITRYKNIRDFTIAAKNFLKNTLNDFAVTFYKNINDCNDRYGVLGAEILFDYGGIVIIDVKSFTANQILNGHTSHCIKVAQSTWDDYVTDKYNKQYYVYNFNLDSIDKLSTIGITIGDTNRVTNLDTIIRRKTVAYAHLKDDTNVASEIESIINRWESKYNIDVPSQKLVLNNIKINHLWDIFQPISEQEIKLRLKATEADRNIIKPGLSIELIKRYIKEDGANINKDKCKALLNAVEENDLEKAKVILQLGGDPNLEPNGVDSIINKSKGLDMIKLLVEYKSNLTCEVFGNICNDVDAVKYCLDQGLDPNFTNFYPIRRCCVGSWKSVKNMGESYMNTFLLIIKYSDKSFDVEHIKATIIHASDYGRLDILEYAMAHSRGVNMDEPICAALKWLKHDRKIDDITKQKTAQYLRDRLSPTFIPPKETKIFTPEEFYIYLGFDKLK